jgi:hypothetical protein
MIDSVMHGFDSETEKQINSFCTLIGIVYGQGCYFSASAEYSHSYATPSTLGERFMFLAKVLTGKSAIGNSSMRVPPTGYDTTTDGNNIFVTYHDAQAYAEYLIVYK